MSANIHFISAGAGSGKTYALTQKLEELLSSEAVEPAGVIATTFTRLAAAELKERVRSKLIEANQLSVANRLFGQSGYPFYDDFLALNADIYGAPLEELRPLCANSSRRHADRLRPD